MAGLVAILAIVPGHSVWSGGVLPVVANVAGWTILIRGLRLSPPEVGATLFGTFHFEQFFYAIGAVSFIIFYFTYGGSSSKCG